MKVPVGENSEYVNLGDWISYFTYGVFDGETFDVKKFGLSYIGDWNSYYPDKLDIVNLIIYNRFLNSPGIAYYGVAIRNMGPLSVAKSENSSIQLYPVPAGNYVYLKGEKIVRVRSLSTNGQIELLNHEGDKIDLSKLNTGLYTLVIETSESIITKKIIKN